MPKTQEEIVYVSSVTDAFRNIHSIVRNRQGSGGIGVDYNSLAPLYINAQGTDYITTHAVGLPHGNNLCHGFTGRTHDGRIFKVYVDADYSKQGVYLPAPTGKGVHVNFVYDNSVNRAYVVNNGTEDMRYQVVQHMTERMKWDGLAAMAKLYLEL